jgi:hypothetical protein
VRERDVFVLVVNIIRQFVVHVRKIGHIGLVVDFAGRLADDGEKRSHTAAGVGEIEGRGNLRDSHWHGFRLPSEQVSFASKSGI